MVVSRDFPLAVVKGLPMVVTKVDWLGMMLVAWLDPLMVVQSVAW